MVLLTRERRVIPNPPTVTTKGFHDVSHRGVVSLAVLVLLCASTRMTPVSAALTTQSTAHAVTTTRFNDTHKYSGVR